MAMAPTAGVTSFIRRHPLKTCVLVFIALFELMHFFALPKITASQLAFPVRDPIKIELPDILKYRQKILRYKFNDVRDLYRFKMDWHESQQTHYIMYIHGCVTHLTVNRTSIPFSKTEKCDFYHGMQVDFRPYLQPGINSIEIITTRRGFHMAPVIFNRGDPQLSDVLGGLMLLVCCAGIVIFTRRLTGEAGTGIILCAGLLAYTVWFCYTGFIEYAMDMPFHLTYVGYIATHFTWPSTYQGWLSYHPPTYYTLMAVLLYLGQWLGSFDATALLRSFSLICTMVFLIYCALILKRVLHVRWIYYLMMAFITFYPASILYAARIDSHLLFYPIFTAGLYYTLRWMQENDLRQLGRAIALSGFALSVRSNAILLAPLMGLAGLWQMWRGKFRLRELFSPAVRIAWMAVLFGLAINFGRTAYYDAFFKDSESYLIGNSSSFKFREGFNLTNSFEHLWGFDFQAYVQRAWWHPAWENNGKEYFFNSVLKSSVSGEFVYPQRGQRAKIAGDLLLALLVYTATISLYTGDVLRKRLEWRVCAITFWTLLMALMMNRIAYPYGPSHDFRYIYPVLVALAGLMGLAFEELKARRHIIVLGFGIVIVVAFCASSLVLYMPVP